MRIASLLLFVLFLGSTDVVLAESVHWRFEGAAGRPAAATELTLSGAAEGGWVVGVAQGSPKFSAEAPGPFIYDPQARRSLENRGSLEFAGNGWLEVRRKKDADGQPFPAGSFTLELFFKPRQENAGWLAGKTRESDAAATFALQPNFLRQHNQTYCGAWLQVGKEAPRRWNTGHYLSRSRIHRQSLDWRHMALVYDADAKSVVCWTNYFESASQPVTGDWQLDLGPWTIGGGPNQKGFEGLIDEVRITPAVLRPAEFLRARAAPIENVDFKSENDVLPRELVVDVREAFGAVGDGKTDDTAAFNTAFAELADKVPLAYYTLYIPPGEYLVSDTLRWSRFLFVEGAGADRTTIRLKDQAAGFDDPKSPRPLLRASSTSGPPGSNRQVNGSSIGNYLRGVKLDTGRSNPGAKGCEYHSNNHGCLEQVVIRSGDGAGVIGLDLTHKTNGPALIKEVTIEGFDVGVAFDYQEYSMTLERLILRGQNKAGIHNRANIMALRSVVSENRVPALVSEGGNSMITLLDAQFSGGDPAQPAIRAEGGLYVRNLVTAGYGLAIEKTVIEPQGRDQPPLRSVKRIDGPHIDEFVGDRVVCPRGAASGSLKLPIEETPEIPRGDVTRDWVSVERFAQLAQDDDWTAAVQAAIDSGAATVYFPRSRTVRGTIHLRGPVVRLFGGGKTQLHRPQGMKSDEPIMIYDHPSADKTVAIERLRIAGFVHAGPATLVVRHGQITPYRTRAGAGKLFLENVESDGWHFDHPQLIWARQWNPEAHGPGPNITSRGATIWALGFKTEYESSKLWAEEAARTEILGGFVYPVVRGIPADRPIFKNVNSELSVVYGTSVYVANHELHILDIGPDGEHRIGNQDLRWHGSRARMDLYRSHPDGER